jgi:hypothetical protein
VFAKILLALSIPLHVNIAFPFHIQMILLVKHVNLFLLLLPIPPINLLPFRNLQNLQTALSIPEWYYQTNIYAGSLTGWTISLNNLFLILGRSFVLEGIPLIFGLCFGIVGMRFCFLVPFLAFFQLFEHILMSNDLSTSLASLLSPAV